MSENTAAVRLPAPSATGSEETVPLFYIGDTEFRIPKRPKLNLALKYLKNLKQHGDNVATAQLLTDLLGEDGFAALADYDDLTDEQLESVMTAAQKHTLGALEANRGNSGSGPKK